MKKISVTKADAARMMASNEPKKLVIECRDSENSLARLIGYMQSIGNGGHSFGIIVDPDSKEYKKNFGWDGDGGDSIISVSLMDDKGETKEIKFDKDGNIT